MEKIWLKNYQAGVPTVINLDNYTSLADLFVQSCEKFKSQAAYQSFGCHLTYQRLAELTNFFAAFLQQHLQLTKGERVALMLPNTLQYPVVLFGALQAGLIVVNVNPLYTADELARQMNDAKPTAIIVLANYAHVVQAALAKIETGFKHIIVTELGDLLTWPKSLLLNWGVKYIKRIVPRWSLPNQINFNRALTLGSKLKLQPVSIQQNDIAFLQYTGGTTGVPKGAILTHRNLLANIEQIVAWMRPVLNEGREIAITALPLYHIFALTLSCLSFLRFGALCILITDPRDIPALIKTLAKTPFTVLPGVNTLFNALLNNPAFANINFSHLKVALGGGAAVLHPVAEHWQQVTGKVLLEGYGLTEASPVVCADPLNLTTHNRSIGLPLPSTDISIRDELNIEVGVGEIGELCVKGPQVMQGYWQNALETKNIFTVDGWLRTGDLARIDEQGFVYIVDRKKDIIIVSGFNVYPNEVEEVLAAHPGVSEVAVIGITDARAGEAVKAFVVKKDIQLTLEALKAYSRQHLTGYKVPHHIVFCDSLPKTAVGKVLDRKSVV